MVQEEALLPGKSAAETATAEAEQKETKRLGAIKFQWECILSDAIPLIDAV